MLSSINNSLKNIFKQQSAIIRNIVARYQSISPVMFQASLASWVTLLRIMGDLPDHDYGEGFAVAGVRMDVCLLI